MGCLSLPNIGINFCIAEGGCAKVWYTVTCAVLGKSCYSYCYILKVTSYFASYFIQVDTLSHHLNCRVCKFYFNYKYPVLCKTSEIHDQQQNCIKHII